MRVSLLLLTLALPAGGCSFNGSTDSNGEAGSSDAGSDGPPSVRADAGPDAEPSCESFSSLVETCNLTAPDDSLDLSISGRYTYDTDDGTLVDPNGDAVVHESDLIAAAEGEVRLIYTSQVLLGSESQLRGVGSRPLGILSFGDIDIQGQIDVGSGGAGERSDCAQSTGQRGGDRNAGAGGGGGGGFQGAGGDGGEGDSDGSEHGAIGPGGTAAATPQSPLGGCRGGDGGDGEDNGGNAGRAGGAIYLASSSLVTISGSIQAGGQGGRGGQESGSGFADAGGGGGGSGGYIAIEAPTLTLSGTIAANGGGGGEGSGDGDQGNNGSSGRLSDVPANGGSGGSPTGSNGGVGAAGATLEGASVTNSQAGGAGGGGGGAGFIFVSPLQTLGGTVSPPAL